MISSDFLRGVAGQFQPESAGERLAAIYAEQIATAIAPLLAPLTTALGAQIAEALGPAITAADIASLHALEGFLCRN